MNQEGGMSRAALIITIVVVLILIVGVGFFLKTRIDKLTATPTPTPTATITLPSEEPTPTPEPSFDRSKYTLRILNGTKTAGLAASVSAKLKELGYAVGRTGNASTSAETTISVKESATGLFEALVKDLSPDYAGVAGDALKDTEDVDAEIIIGAE
jgi:hypothetical protein